jgi:paraquat-inducible protein A
VTRADNSLTVCERCGKAHRWVPLAPGDVAHCTRCAAVIARGHRLDGDTVLALTVTALVVFLIAATSDVLTVSLGGKSQSATVPEAVNIIWDEGQPLMALATAGTALLAPALYIFLRLYILVPVSLVGRVPPGFGACMRALHQVTRWGMVEVLTVGGLLSLVRLAALADATPGPAMIALGVLTMLFAAIESAGLHHLWRTSD